MDTIQNFLKLAKTQCDLFENPSKEVVNILFEENEIDQVKQSKKEQLTQLGLDYKKAKIGVVYEDQYRYIINDPVQFPDGSFGTYLRVVCKHNGVLTLPIYEKDKILLIRHFRHGSRQWHFETTRGMGEEGVSGRDNAIKELEEEIGAQVSELISLGTIFIDPGILSDEMEIYLAHIESYGDPERMDGITEIIPVKVSEIEKMIANNIIADSFTIVAYTRAKLKGLI